MITQAQYLEMLSRTERNPVRDAVPDDAADHESDLQEQIEAECRYRLWPCVRTRMDRRTTFTLPGVPDCIIAADRGRTFWIECKTRTGKQTVEQMGFQALCARNNHVYAVIRSFGEFLALVRI